MKNKYRICAVQLDLARQMETVEFIKGFIDFIARNHYNTLLLYLEWRVRTKSVDLGKAEGYSAEELKEIIGYAAQHGVSIIPGLATLGHADLLLKKEEFKPLSELRDGSKGRITASPALDIDLCPSSAAVRQLLTNYLTEVSEIFEASSYLHIGADEVYNIGYCPECRKKTETFAGEQELFLQHIKFVHELVVKLGKRMMMWDDMFEIYPDILSEVPRDVIMVNWLYRENVPCFYGHFSNQRFEDWLERYDRLGFEYLIAPADYTFSNPQTFTEYAENHHPAGGLLTTWEKAGSLMYKYYPNIAMVGQLWGGEAEDGGQAMKQGLKQLFSMENVLFQHAIEAYASQANYFPTVSLADLTIFDFNGPDHVLFHSLQAVTSILTQYQGRLQDTSGEIILKDILFDCRFKLLKMRCAISCWKYFKGMRHEAFDQLKKELESAAQEYIPFYEAYRPENSGNILRHQFGNWLTALDKVSTSTCHGCLTVLFAQPDYYGAAWSRILVNGKELTCQCFKCGGKPYYEVILFLSDDEEIKEVRFEVFGFGGQGIAYVSGKTAKGLYIPAAVSAASGVVEHPEMILTNNVNYAFLGLHDVQSAYRDRSKAAMISSITVTMQKSE
ncbi:MAG: family 20 glycosylhydrolase [Oligosphaeraceae bacterium]|nr:family 20 glycosylhydrolase [Oligosphaeraceae bacterium]